MPDEDAIPGCCYLIINVEGRRDAHIEDFIGPTSFHINVNGTAYRVDGAGTRDGIGVRFHQTNRARTGRTWRMCAVPGTGLMAEPQPTPPRN
jgi:hypothetical protein